MTNNTTRMTLRQLRNVLPAGSLSLHPDSFYQVINYNFPTTFRRNSNGQVTISGEIWGTLEELMNTTVLEITFDKVTAPTVCKIWVKR